MTSESVRLLHISDLHFCEDSIRPQLETAKDIVNSKDFIDLEFHFDHPKVIKALDKLIGNINPDGLIISGDITTLGDSKSYSKALKWLQPHLQREGGARPCIIVPGNHDILLAHFRELRARLPELNAKRKRFLIRIVEWFIRRIYPELYIQYRNDLSKLLEIFDELFQQELQNIDDPFHNFRTFANEISLNPNFVSFELKSHSKIYVYPCNSVSSDSRWINLGNTDDSERQRLSRLLDPLEEGVLRILVLHHNPISSPYRVETPLVSAYNGMPDGPNFLATMQKSGIDLFLYGHQHEDALLEFDFELESSGHAIALASRSSSQKEHGGCNLIEVHDINHAQVFPYNYCESQQAFSRSDITRSLCFERHRPVDSLTVTSRYETKQLIPNHLAAHSLWEEILQPGSEIIYIAGRHLAEASNEKLSELGALLDGPPACHVRFLVNNPALLQFLDNQLACSSSKEIYGKEVAQLLVNKEPYNVWGENETLGKLAQTAQENVKKLKEHINNKLSESQRKRVDLRLSHTVLPFAAMVRDPSTDWGKMVVRLLPMGAFHEVNNPVIKFNQRTNEALYYYYLKHLKILFQRGITIAGEWKSTDDLESN